MNEKVSFFYLSDKEDEIFNFSYLFFKKIKESLFLCEFGRLSILESAE